MRLSWPDAGFSGTEIRRTLILPCFTLDQVAFEMVPLGATEAKCLHRADNSITLQPLRLRYPKIFVLKFPKFQQVKYFPSCTYNVGHQFLNLYFQYELILGQRHKKGLGTGKRGENDGICILLCLLMILAHK